MCLRNDKPCPPNQRSHQLLVVTVAVLIAGAWRKDALSLDQGDIKYFSQTSRKVGHQLTKDQRTEAIFQVQQYLGPVFPVWGVIQTETGWQCECSLRKKNSYQLKLNPGPCENQGKHPRILILRTASSNPKKLAKWLKKYPIGNFGVLMGVIALLIDLDVRDGKDGVASLAAYAQDHNQVVPATVTARSGSGARHLFFRKPEGFDLTARTGVLPGVDMKNFHQIAIAAGSQHLSGGFYQFEAGLGPAEIALAPLPDFLRDLLLSAPASRKSSTGESASRKPSFDSNEVAALVALELPPAGEVWPDKIVEGVMRSARSPLRLRNLLKKDAKGSGDRSVDDFYVARQLAFYCGHHLDQAWTLFRKYRWRPKLDRRYCIGHPATYAEVTLRKAFFRNTGNWKRGKRKKVRKFRTTNKGIFRAKMGRPASTETLAIIYYSGDNPTFSPKQIAADLSLKVGNVRRVLRLHASGRYEGRM